MNQETSEDAYVLVLREESRLCDCHRHLTVASGHFRGLSVCESHLLVFLEKPGMFILPAPNWKQATIGVTHNSKK